MNDPKQVAFVPLGGLGEIGMNCFALVQGDEILVVDCGAVFPDDDLGVDLIVPDFTWLVQRSEKIAGVFITHGHEDHIGAIPHLLRTLGSCPPIYAPAHACALMASRLKEHELSTESLHIVEAGSCYSIGSFEVEPIAVAHSIVGATALSITTRAGIVLHTADFDLDAEQPAGTLTDEARLREIGEAGVRLLLSDSTNIDTERRSLSEGDVGRALRRLVAAQEQRVIFGLFSSNVHRLLALVQAAQETGRKICFLGRSLRRHFEIATELGYLNFPSDLLIAPEALATHPRAETLILAGGSQGEGASSLRRLSQGAYPLVVVSEGDTVMLSSRVIPGNEKAVFTMVNDFARRGVKVLSRVTDPEIHTSGHASREELTRMIEWIRPEAFVPVHGTLHHLLRHRELAVSLGVLDSAVVENGTPVRFSSEGSLSLGERVPHGQVRIAIGGAIMDGKVRRRRGDMARRGTALISVFVDDRGDELQKPSITILGVPGADDDARTEHSLLATVSATIRNHHGQRMISLEEAIKRAVSKTFQELCRARPLVVVHVGHPR